MQTLYKHLTFMIITYSIIGITVLLSLYAFNHPNVLNKCIMNPYLITSQGQYYRFITSGFIHKDHVHLLFNMIALYFFGSVTEQVFDLIFGGWSSVYYVALYLLAIVVSDIPTYFKHRSNPGYNALGASGGVSAIIFAFILFQPTQDICLYFALCLPGFILGTLYLVYSYFQGKKSRDGINHDAHLYGALFGLVFCIVLYPPSIRIFWEQLSQWRWNIFN